MWIAMSLLAALTILGFGIREVMFQHRLQRGGTRASGPVVHHRMSSSGEEGGPVCLAVVEFAVGTLFIAIWIWTLATGR